MNFKKNVSRIPVAGFMLHLMNDLLKLNKNNKNIYLKFEELNSRLSSMELVLKNIESSFDSFQKNIDSVKRQVSFIEKNSDNKSLTGTKTSNTEGLFADNHLLDEFYTSFEDIFRGNEKIIKKNLRVYVPYLNNSGINFNKYPVLDIGSGRGEMLSLLSENKIKASGLDINIDMVERANKKGLHTILGDAISYLENTESSSIGAITGFHIVEHIPFPQLLKLFQEAYRCVTRNGVVIFETPNPENLTVGSTTFYLDPSHLKPLPPELLKYAMQSSGFRDVEILRLHELKKTKDIAGLPSIEKYIYGPRDYAVIARK